VRRQTYKKFYFHNGKSISGTFKEQKGSFDIDLEDFVPGALRTVEYGAKEGIHRGIGH
jgi:hypothetical protein